MTLLILSRLHPLWRRVAAWTTGVSLLAALAACSDGDSGSPTDPQRIPVAAVRIEPLDEVLVVGDTRTLRASPLSSSGAVLDGRVIAWDSENSDVASVSASGQITARAAGHTGIRASSEGKSSRIEVNIVAPNPSPVLTSLTPAVIAAGTVGPLAVDVQGFSFTDATRLRIDGAEQATTRVDATTLRLTLSSAAMASSGTISITAATPPPGGGVSNALVLRIEEVAAPTITDLDPRQITAGWSGSFTLKVLGSGFTQQSVVWWDGAPRATTYLSATALRITINPQDVALARGVPVTVETPAPGGGRATAMFTVNPVPVARVEILSPYGFAWTWLNHRLPLTAVAQNHLGQEIPNRFATWSADPFVASVVRTGDQDVAVYGVQAGTTDVEATIDGVRAQRNVRILDAPNYEIVYEAGEGDNRHLMLWDLATANAPRRLPTPMVAFSPSPSPDGREFAFAGVDRGAGTFGNVEIFILGRDGSTRRVSPSSAFDGDPAFSPDGSKLAFTSSREKGSLDVYVIDLVTGALSRLTDADMVSGTAGSGMGARAPAWSPDGTQIAYTVQTLGGSQLWVMTPQGTNKRQLTGETGSNDLDPVWSPDGSVIAFAREFRQPKRSAVMTVKSDGSGLTPIGGRTVGIAATPSYSPDGHWLTTAQTRGSGSGALYAFSIDYNAGPRIVMPEELGGGRSARWVRRP